MTGDTDKAKGKVKEAYGTLSGDDALQAEGKHDQLAGDAKNAASDAEDKVEHGIDKVKDAIESAIDKTKAALHRD